jgi:hypothetical protein
MLLLAVLEQERVGIAFCAGGGAASEKVSGLITPSMMPLSDVHDARVGIDFCVQVVLE